MITNFCIACNSKFNLETHHLIPQSIGGTNNDNNIITLCNQCHGIFHGMKNRSTSKELTRRGLDKKRCIFFIIRLIHECWADKWLTNQHLKLICEGKIYYHNDINYENMFSYNEILDKYISICNESNLVIDLVDISKSKITRALNIYKTDILYYDYLCRFYDTNDKINYKECKLLRDLYS